LQCLSLWKPFWKRSTHPTLPPLVTWVILLVNSREVQAVRDGRKANSVCVSRSESRLLRDPGRFFATGVECRSGVAAQIAHDRRVVSPEDALIGLRAATLRVT